MDTKKLIAEAEAFFNKEAVYFEEKITQFCPTPVPTIVAFCCKIGMTKKELAELCKQEPTVQRAMDMAVTHIERILTEQSLADMIPNSVAIKALQNLAGWDKNVDAASDEPDISPEQRDSAIEAVVAAYGKR